jgi:hypothetical protein
VHDVATDAAEKDALKSSTTASADHDDVGAPSPRSLHDRLDDRGIHHHDLGICPSPPKTTLNAGRLVS